ncbi:pilus assembly protein CpaC [Hoeflea sp. BAL378]|uniref:type II and III secretion system protein family protein n=1 Tax=Hoeflea sp. BAL378 TaxID=1547437 RepID=UPI0005137B75|nr:type II and III secretion system protein family protein [Hoeflea sp. BAL378]KGF70147.1 pilus assembly protein CpaC [Hoeflea sp. BAL378]
MNVRHIAKSLLSSITGFALVGTAVFAGVALEPSGGRLVAAAGAAESVIRISQTGPGATKRIKLGLNKAIVIDLPTDAHDILVADPSLADAVTRTSRRLYLFGKTVGQTNIFIFGPSGEEIVAIDLEIERDVSGLQAHLARFLPDSDIKVEIISDNIVLTGSVRTPQDAAQAANLAQIFLTGGEATTREITAAGTEGGTSAIFAEGRQKSQIVNLLKIDGEDQVTLKITVAEVSREVLKQLGFNNSVSNSSGVDVLTLNNAANIASGGISGTITGSLGKYGIESVLNAMEQAKVIRTLAEPSLTAISGESATFTSGGEILRNVFQPNGSVATQSYEYGIKLNFTPVVLSAGRISLKISTEVSEPLAEGATTEFRKRQIETSVELPSGGSIALAGLVRDNVQQDTRGVPGANKIPVFGTMFRNKSFSRVETELVVIATPYLVKPVARNALARPDDNFNPPSDGAGFFLGRVNRVYGHMETDLQPGRYHGAVGFIYK